MIRVWTVLEGESWVNVRGRERVIWQQMPCAFACNNRAGHKRLAWRVETVGEVVKEVDLGVH
jgi:hypothetical protein